MTHGVANSKVEIAMTIALCAHAGQVDKQGQPYILHPMRVGGRGKTEAEQIVGILHDVVEDTDFPIAHIEEQFGKEIVNALLSVTRGWFVGGMWVPRDPNKGFRAVTPARREVYTGFIARCAANPVGRMVKILDIEDNLGRMDGLSDTAERDFLQVRYNKALVQLKHTELNSRLTAPRVPLQNVMEVLRGS